MNRIKTAIASLITDLKAVFLGSHKLTKNTGSVYIFSGINIWLFSAIAKVSFIGFPLSFLTLIGILLEYIAISELTYSRERSFKRRLFISIIIWSLGALIISYGGIGLFIFYGIKFSVHIPAIVMGLTYYLPTESRLDIFNFLAKAINFSKNKKLTKASLDMTKVENKKYEIEKNPDWPYDYPEDECVELLNGKWAWRTDESFTILLDKSVWEKKYKDSPIAEDWEEDDEDPQKMQFRDFYLIYVENGELVDDVEALCDHYEIDEEDLDI